MQSAKNQKILQIGLVSKAAVTLFLTISLFNPLRASTADLAGSTTSKVIKKGTQGVFSPDGTVIALTIDSENISLHDASTGKLIRIIENGTFQCFSPDGSLLTKKPKWKKDASGSHRHIFSPSFILWNITTGERIHKFKGERHPTFSPDGTMLAIGTTNADTHFQDVLLYNVLTGELIHTFAGEYPLFSPDGSTIATQVRGFLDDYADGALWNVTTGELIYTFNGRHLRFIPQPDGDLLILAARDWNKRPREDEFTVWNIKTGELVLTLEDRQCWASNYYDAILQALQKGYTATPGKKANLQDFTTGEVERTYAKFDESPGFVIKDPFAKYKNAFDSITLGAGLCTILSTNEKWRNAFLGLTVGTFLLSIHYGSQSVCDFFCYVGS